MKYLGKGIATFGMALLGIVLTLTVIGILVFGPLYFQTIAAIWGHKMHVGRVSEK